MSGQRFCLTVTLLDDLHSGTGGSAGEIDAVQAVDRKGRPVLRATHLRGVLRAAAEELEKLDAAYAGLADALFGSNKHGKRGLVQLQSLYYQSAASKGDWSQVWTSSSRGTDDDPLSRTARGDTLRVIEYVAAGSVFVGELFLRDSAKREALDLCVKRMQFLGGRRSRGDGLVQCVLEPDSTEPASFSETPTRALRLLLRNLDPVCFAATGSPGNIIPCEGYLRGQRLFGALADWALAQSPLPEHALDDLWRGRVWVGDAYPLPTEVDGKSLSLSECEVLPVPQFIGEPKTSITTTAGLLPHWAKASGGPRVLNTKAKNRFKDNDRQLKRPKGYEFLFRTEPGKAWRRYTPEIGVHMRNQIQRSELFSEQEIAEDTLFLADVRFADQAAAERFKTCFESLLAGNEWLALGRGGRPAKIDNAAFLTVADETQQAVEKVAALSVTLEADLIARVRRTDSDLPPLFGFYDDLTPECLADLVQLPADGIAHCTWESFSDTEEVRGFNAASGLPTAPVLTIQRGSAVAIQAKDEAGQGFLAALRQALAAKCFDGLGERREAGFGRFRIDFNPLDTLGTSEEKAQAAALPVNSAEQLCRQAAIFVEPLVNKEKMPSRSQWRWFLSELRKTGASASAVLDKIDLQSEKKGGEAWKNVKASLRAELQGCETEALKLQLAELIVRYLEPKDRHD